jgi:hypothetical protein
MADVAALVRKHLEIPAHIKRINYYTLFQVDELLDDRTTIAVAVEQTIEKLKKVDRSLDPQAFEQVVKVVRQARATLLDDQKKALYDNQLRQSLKTNHPSTADDSSTSQSMRLQAVLPPGDPTAPFSMSDFLKSEVETEEEESVEERHRALDELIQASKADSRSNAGGSGVRSFDKPKSSARPTSHANRELQSQIRRNRKKKNLVASAAVLGVSCLIVFAGATLFVMNRPKSSTEVAQKFPPINLEPQAATTTEPAVNPVNEAEAKLKKSPVGKLPPIGSAQALPELGENSAQSLLDKQNKKKGGADSNAMEASDSSKMPSMNKSPDAKPPTSEPTKPPGNPQVWSQAMNEARDAIVARKFEDYNRAITKALQNSPSDEQTKKTERLDYFGQAYQKGQEIIQARIGKLAAGHEISFGSAGSKAAVVESKPGSLILRIQGKNQTLSHDKLPMGIVLSLLRLELTETPLDELILGTVCLLDPRSSPATKGQAKSHFEKAAGDDRFLGLDQILDQKY